MGAGGDARPQGQVLKRVGSGKAKLDNVKNDLKVLKSIWLNRVSGDDHAERLESFYGPQAAECAPSSRCIVGGNRWRQAARLSDRSHVHTAEVIYISLYQFRVQGSACCLHACK